MRDVEKRFQVFQPGYWEDGDISRKKNKKNKKSGERTFQGLGIKLHRHQHKAVD